MTSYGFLPKAARVRSPSDSVVVNPHTRVLQQRGFAPTQALTHAPAAHDLRRLPIGPPRDVPRDLRARFEGAYDIDLSGVRLRESAEPDRIDADAFMRGDEIHVSPEQYRPHTMEGRTLIAHELGHFVQRQRRTVHATHHASGLAVNEQPHLENEAETLARHALRAPPMSAAQPAPPESLPSLQSAIQASNTHSFESIRIQPPRNDNVVQPGRKKPRRAKKKAAAKPKPKPPTIPIKSSFSAGKKRRDIAKATKRATRPLVVATADVAKALRRSPRLAAPKLAAPRLAAPKDNSAEARLKRLTARAEKRPALPPLSTLAPVPTKFGVAGISRQRWSPNDPQITTKKKNFPRTENPGAPYSGWGGGGASDGRAIAKAIVKRDPAGLTPQQKRNAALLQATTQLGEGYRHRGAPKIARSVFRKVASGQRTYQQGFAGDAPDFAQSAQGGAQFYHKVQAGTATLTPHQRKALEDLSESSEEEP